MKRHLYNHTMVIYIQYKFHKITSIGYLGWGQKDGKTEGWMDRLTDRQPHTIIPPPLVGDNKSWIVFWFSYSWINPLSPCLQEVFHVYLNEFENAVTHLFLVIFGNNCFFMGKSDLQK